MTLLVPPLVLCCCFFFTTTDALVVPQSSTSSIFTINASRNQHHHKDIHQQRRGVLKKAFYILPIVTSTTSNIRPSNALEQCKPKSHNCIRTTWTAPSSITKLSDAAVEIRNVLNSYPQNGQAGVDCNGWKIVSDTFDTTDTEAGGGGLIILEYQSCVGAAAMAINLGQPFIDDLKLELLNDKSSNSTSGRIVVEVKSSSRMGSSDLFVNRKRLEYLGQELKQNGWDVPPPKYVYEK